MSDAWKIIGRGQCGWHAEISGCRGSGGSLEHYVADAEIGALVYDAENADDAAFSNLVICGPMVNTDLAWDEVKKLSQAARSAALDMVGPGGLQGSFETLAKACQNQHFGGLDYVGLGVYETLLRRVIGMRIGRVVSGGTVEWAPPIAKPEPEPTRQTEMFE